MKRWYVCIVVFIVCGLSFSRIAMSADRGPSTAEERAKAVALVRGLESDPLGDSAFQSRRWLTQWLIDVPDISVNWCTDLMAPLLKSRKHPADVVSVQPLFSASAFIIEHPDKATDQFAINTAGVEGALRAYETILKTDPKAHVPFLDDLIEKRGKGLLPDYVRAAQKQCK